MQSTPMQTKQPLATTRGFRVHSLKRKMIALMIILLAALTASLTYISFTEYREDALSRSASMLQDTVEQISMNLENYFEEINHVSMQVFYNSTIMEALADEPTGIAALDMEKRRLIERELRQEFLLARNDVLSCYIIADDVYRVAQKSADLDSDKEYASMDWYQAALNGRSRALLVSDAGQSQMVCSIVRRMISVSNLKKFVGVLKINFSYDGIADICNMVQSEYQGQLCVLGESGNAVYGTAPAWLRNLPAVVDGVSYGYDPSTQTRYMVNQCSVPAVGWRVVLLHSVPILEAGAYKTMLRMVLVAVVCLLAAGSILLMFMRSFLTPLGDVITSMRSIRSGNQNERVPVSRNDEVGYLAISFNEMLDRVRATQNENTRLMKEVYEAELLQRDIQLEVLSRQIEPHFIFNVLNMIAIEAQMGQTDQCVENIGRLSALLRALAHYESKSTLGGEIALIRNYLNLVQSRYEDRLSYSIDISDAYADIPFPPLSLQPLIENAIIHGCEVTSKHTHIHIGCYCEKDTLVLTIADDAGGIPADKLAVLQSSLQMECGEGKGIGVVNVHRRIKLLYGDEYGLSIASERGTTTVTLRVPHKQLEKERMSHV